MGVGGYSKDRAPASVDDGPPPPPRHGRVRRPPLTTKRPNGGRGAAGAIVQTKGGRSRLEV
eukprot:11191996-Lingulodinium_polyedra.AAC.1